MKKLLIASVVALAGLTNASANSNPDDFSAYSNAIEKGVEYCFEKYRGSSQLQDVCHRVYMKHMALIYQIGMVRGVCLQQGKGISECATTEQFKFDMFRFDIELEKLTSNYKGTK